MKRQQLFKIFGPITKNKYLLTLVIFLIWIIFFDRDSIVDRFRSIKTLNKLKAEKEFYEEQLVEDRENLNKLQDKDFLEKFAREEHWMKKDNEDIFVVIED
jgi:cell division protein DivIC